MLATLEDLGPRPAPSARDATDLDRELVRLTRAEAELDRQLAIGLADFWDRKCYLALSRARASEFVREHLGIQMGRAHWLARLGRHLLAVPELDRALAQRRINASQVIELGRIMTKETPAEERRAWIDRGARLSVRHLRKEVQAEVLRRKEEGEGVDVEPPPDPDQVPAGSWVNIPAPAPVGDLWHQTLEFARIVAGRQLTLAQAVDFISAECLSACNPDPAPLALIADSSTHVDAPADDSSDPVVLRPAPPPEDVEPDSSIRALESPWELGKALERIAEQKQRLRYELAGLLGQFAEHACAGALGFATFERYCCDRLGFSLRRAQRLIRYRAALDRFPKLAAACLAGHISYTAVLLLLPILHRTTEEEWVDWAKDRTYRAVERVAEYAQTFATPEVAEAAALAAATPDGEATAFSQDPLPLGTALPPIGNGPPRIVGLPKDLALADPEKCVARIRFWLQRDVLDHFQRALHACRQSLRDALAPTWSVFQVLLVHFIQTHDNPETRAWERDHPIIARDGCQCLTPGCMSRAMLEDHHLKFRGQRGSNDWWNRGGLCFCHHRPGVHRGGMRMGGFAPDDLVFKLGLHPVTGIPFVCYHNERRISAEEADRLLDDWRLALREGREALSA